MPPLVGVLSNMPRNANAAGPPSIRPVYSHRPITIDRAPGNLNDDLIQKNRSPWYHTGYYLPAPLTQPSWMDSGPTRPNLNLHRVTYRKEAGAFNSDTVGMHTMLPAQPKNLGSRKPQEIKPGRQNRLSSGIYRGQSFSETTIKQGS